MVISGKGKNGTSLPRDLAGASQVNDCVKINHCKDKLKQYDAAVLILGSLTPSDKKVTI